MWLLLCLALAGSAVTSTRAETDPIARGRQLYHEGTGLTAVAGPNDRPVPAAFVACASCHGADGRGKLEAGIEIPNITWAELGKPYPVTLANGRRRPGYDPEAFLALLTTGRDTADQVLQPTMPRYQLSATDADALSAYLASIETDGASGVTNTTIRIGLVHRSDEATDAEAAWAFHLLTAWFDEINAAGGIYRRHLELVPVSPDAPTLPLLAVFTSDWIGGQPETHSAPAPSAALSFRPIAPFEVTRPRYTFALYPNLVGRTRALLRHATAHRTSTAPDAPPPQLVLVSPPDPAHDPSTAALVAVMESFGPTRTVVATSANLSATAADIVVVHDRELDPTALRQAFRARDLDPLLLWPEPPLATATRADDRAFTTELTLPTDVSFDTVETWRAWAGMHDLPLRQLARQFALLSTAKLLTTAIQNTGRELTTDRLVEQLEAMQDFKTGLTPTLRLSPREHTASGGVYVVPLTHTGGSPTRGEWVRIN